MPIEPTAWNIVVAGAWNPAILTPDGVRRRLFQLPDATPVEIEVALDQAAPFRIGHQGITVVTTTQRLEIGMRHATPELLRRAAELCRRALEQLPETPVAAAGVNVRYGAAEFPDSVFDLLRAPLDGALADAGYQVDESVTKRTVRLAPGVVNLQIIQAQAGGKVEFNFHRSSTNPTELREWLARVDEFLAVTDRAIAILGLQHVHA